MINHHNFAYEAGPTFPTAIGDRYYAQDLARDYWSEIDDAGKKVAGGFDGFPVILKDSNITKGTLWTDINIPIARGIVAFEVDVPNSYAALPPTVTQEDVYCRIETTAEVDFDISGTATLDGATPNYIKVTYSETDGSTRTRAKKAGSYVYEKAISYTITVDAVAPTDYDLCLGTLIGDGAASLIIESYTRTRHLNGSYDYVVETQEDWNIIIDYTAANQYRIKDNVKSIYVKYLAGGYQMTGATSPLQEGNVYGYIETNDCTRIVFEPGAFIDMNQNIGYLEVDTDYCYLDGVSIQGDIGGAAAIVRSFLLNANYVLFDNCNSQLRKSNVAFTVFEGSATPAHNETSQIEGCFVDGIESSDIIYGYKDFHNINNCNISNCVSTGNTIYCFSGITNISNCKITLIDTINALDDIYGIISCINCSNISMEDFDGALIYGISNSKNISNITLYDFESNAGICYGVDTCNILDNCIVDQLDGIGNCYAFTTSTQLTNCYAEDIDSSGGNAYGFYDCDHVIGSYATTCNTGFHTCNYVIGCGSSTNSVDGYNSCNYISSSLATSNTNNGFDTCNYVIGCNGVSNSVDGFNTCNTIGQCQAYNNTRNGFTDCNRVTGCYASTSGADGYNNCDTVVGCYAVSSTGDGFQDCNHIEHNRSTGSGGAAYNNCFADLAATRAAAATDAGGENA